MAQFRTSFLRDLLEALERLRGTTALARLNERLPERLRVQLPAVNRPNPISTIPLDDAEEILLTLDAVADPAGAGLELLAVDLASKLLTQEARVIQRRDLMGTVARMEAAVMRPFLDVSILFEVNRTDTGFALTLGIRGRPRSARVLRPLALGFVRAADRFTLESGRTELRLTSDVFGDRATVGAQYRESIPPPPDPEPIAAEPMSRPSRRMRIAAGSNLSDEVERILSSAMSSSSANSQPPRKISSPSLPRIDTTSSPPSRRASQTGLAAVRPPLPTPATETRTPSGQMAAVHSDDEKSDDPKKA